MLTANENRARDSNALLPSSTRPNSSWLGGGGKGDSGNFKTRDPPTDESVPSHNLNFTSHWFLFDYHDNEATSAVNSFWPGQDIWARGAGDGGEKGTKLKWFSVKVSFSGRQLCMSFKCRCCRWYFEFPFFWYPSLCFSEVYCIREIYPYKKGGDVTTLSLRSVFNLVIGSLINLRVYMKKEFLLL